MPNRLKYKTYNGCVQSYTINENELFPWQRQLLKYVDEDIPDLLVWLFDSESVTEQELFESEIKCNSADGEPINNYASSFETGTTQSVEELFETYSYVWKHWIFMESTDMDFMMIQWYRRISETRPLLVSDSDVFLLLTARMCRWGGRGFFHEYSLYRCVIDGKYKMFKKVFDDMCQKDKWLRDVFLL